MGAWVLFGCTEEEFNERQNKVEMEKQKCPSYFGDYKCHVKTNVKDSKGDFVYVDKCLKEAIENLNAVGLKTIASCCGHGIINPHNSASEIEDRKDMEDFGNYAGIGFDDD